MDKSPDLQQNKPHFESSGIWLVFDQHALW